MTLDDVVLEAENRIKTVSGITYLDAFGSRTDIESETAIFDVKSFDDSKHPRPQNSFYQAALVVFVPVQTSATAAKIAAKNRLVEIREKLIGLPVTFAPATFDRFFIRNRSTAFAAALLTIGKRRSK